MVKENKRIKNLEKIESYVILQLSYMTEFSMVTLFNLWATPLNKYAIYDNNSKNASSIYLFSVKPNDPVDDVSLKRIELFYLLHNGLQLLHLQLEASRIASRKTILLTQNI